MSRLASMIVAFSTAIPFGGSAMAQAPAPGAAPPPPPAYGEPINLETAKKAAAAAQAEAAKNGWGECISVVGPSGDLVYFERMDNCQYGSIAISMHKARAAAIFKRPTRVYESLIAASPQNVNIVTLDGIIASAGGNPIIIGGKLVGAIGCSGATSAQDDQCSQAGVAALQ